MSWVMLEFRCGVCGQVFEELVARKAGEYTAPHCDAEAPSVLSAPRVATSYKVSVERGSTAPPPPNVVDTRPLAEGQSLREWKANRAKKRAKERYAWVKKAVG